MKRKLLSVVLALVLVLSMAVPASAKIWSGNWGGITWYFTITKSASSGRVTMDIDPINVVVGAHGRAFIQATVDGTTAWGRWGEWYQSMTSTINVGNYIYTEDGTIKTGAIQTVEGKGFIGSGDGRTLIAHHILI